jgi:hypothetical protein
LGLVLAGRSLALWLFRWRDVSSATAVAPFALAPLDTPVLVFAAGTVSRRRRRGFFGPGLLRGAAQPAADRDRGPGARSPRLADGRA